MCDNYGWDDIAEDGDFIEQIIGEGRVEGGEDPLSFDETLDTDEPYDGGE